MLWFKIGTSIQGAQARKSQKRENMDSPSFDPLAIAIDGNRRNIIKKQQGTPKGHKQAKRDFGSTVLRSTCHGNRDESKKLEQEGSIHILLDTRGSKERTREDRRMVSHSFNLLDMVMDGG